MGINCEQYVDIDPAVFFPYNISYEYYLPAKEEKEKANPRLPEKKQVKVREKNNPAQEAKRPLETQRLMPRLTLRLQRAKDFEAVFKRGRGVGGEGLFLKMRLTALPTIRFGIVISKKVAAKAVARNRKRRLLKEAIRAYSRELKKGVDAVLVVQPAFAAKNLSQTKVIVEKLFRKASLFT